MRYGEVTGGSAGLFGDGVSVILGTAAIEACDVGGNARAGVSSFGGEVVITGSVLTCNGVDLEGEALDNDAFSFDGSTGWYCSDRRSPACGVLDACHVESTGIAPPSALLSVEPVPPEGLPEP